MVPSELQGPSRLCQVQCVLAQPDGALTPPWCPVLGSLPSLDWLRELLAPALASPPSCTWALLAQAPCLALVLGDAFTVLHDATASQSTAGSRAPLREAAPARARLASASRGCSCRSQAGISGGCSRVPALPEPPRSAPCAPLPAAPRSVPAQAITAPGQEASRVKQIQSLRVET